MEPRLPVNPAVRPGPPAGQAEPFRYRLGLDLGSNSIGWCVLDLDAGGRPCGVRDAGVRILSPNEEAGRDPQSKTSLAAERRDARSARRRRGRFVRRRDRLMETLIGAGLMPVDRIVRKSLERLDPYALRKEALDRRLSPSEIGRALFHLNQRRGFKSNRIISDSDHDERSSMKQGIKRLEVELESAGVRTLGELLANGRLGPGGGSVRFRPERNGSKNLYAFYPTRSMIESEVDAIWTSQRRWHSDLLTDELLRKIKHIIVDQRPLKPQVPGRCTLFSEDARAPKAHPLFQRFRIFQDVGSLRVREGLSERPLRLDERDHVVLALASCVGAGSGGIVPFERLRAHAGLLDGARLNSEGAADRRKGFACDETSLKLRSKNAFDRVWDGLPHERRCAVVERLLEVQDEAGLCSWLRREFGLSPASVFCTLADAGATWASSALLQHIFTILGGDEYMFGKKVFAAMLATVLGASLFGANAAKAVIDLDADVKPAVVTYATETLAVAVEDYDDYYVVDTSSDPDLNLNVMGKVGLGGPPDSFVTVRFDLTGMVFNATPSLDIVGHAGTPSLRDGGDPGEDFVSFISSRGSESRDGSEFATLTVASLGVKPSVGGSVTMTVTDSLGDGAEHTESYTNAVRTDRALQEIAMPLNLQATVEQRFKSFGPIEGTMGTMGTLGSFIVETDITLLNAAGGEAVAVANIYDDAESSVTISGDFSFAETAWLAGMVDCPEGTGDLLQREDEMVMDELMEQLPSVFATAQFLCISVHTGDNAVAIPTTDPYMVTTAYDGGTPMAGWPANDGEYALGRITHDGTTVHIPYLTTWENYNQRIVVSNRGTNPADYEIMFRPEEGVTATPNDMYAMGTLDGGSTIVLRARDVVTLEGGSRTAATFVAEAQSTQIDVATIMVNLMNGSTDTVNYEPEPTD